MRQKHIGFSYACKLSIPPPLNNAYISNNYADITKTKAINDVKLLLVLTYQNSRFFTRKNNINNFLSEAGVTI